MTRRRSRASALAFASWCARTRPSVPSPGSGGELRQGDRRPADRRGELAPPRARAGARLRDWRRGDRGSDQSRSCRRRVAPRRRARSGSRARRTRRGRLGHVCGCPRLGRGRPRAHPRGRHGGPHRAFGRGQVELGEPAARLGRAQDGGRARRGRQGPSHHGQPRDRRFAGGGRVVDMPGVRGLGLWDADAGIEAAFADIEEAASSCPFRDCKHERTGCAVRAAVESGAIAPGASRRIRRCVRRRRP